MERKEEDFKLNFQGITILSDKEVSKELETKTLDSIETKEVKSEIERKSGKLSLNIKKKDFEKDYVFERVRESDGTKAFLSEKDKEVKK
jgi:N-acetylglutamate synthase/N-acetylornithine aminotransferase